MLPPAAQCKHQDERLVTTASQPRILLAANQTVSKEPLGIYIQVR
jgi:hypothetical protein